MMALRECSFLFLLVCFVSLKTTSACGKYKLIAKSISNCGEDDVVKLSDDFTVELDNKCRIVPRGCINIGKDFGALALQFNLDKAPFSDISGKVDVCELTQKPNFVTKILGAFGLPNKCPVKAQQLCLKGDKTFGISFLRPFLGLAAGDLKVKLQATHDSGSTCINIDVAIVG